MIRFLPLILLFCTAIFANPLALTKEKNLYDDFEFSYIKDHNNSLKFKDIQTLQFQNNSSNKFALGYTKGSLWIKIDIQNKSDIENYVLSVGESFYEKIQLYYLSNNTWHLKQTGVFTPIENRDLYTHNLAFKFQVPNDSNQTLYLQLKGQYAYFGNLTIVKEKYFKPYTLLDIKNFYLLLFGICFIIIVFNLFLYLQTKEKIYGYYTGYSFFNLLYIINISGLLIYINMQKYMYTLHFSAAMLIAFLAMFSYEILEMKKYTPKIAKIIPFIFFIGMFFAVMILGNYQPWNKVINNYAGLVTLFLITVSVIIYLKGLIRIKYYVYAMFGYFIFVILFTFMVNGFFEYSTITRYGFIFASAIELVVFSLMLASRFYNINKEYIKSQKKLIDIKNKNEIFLENEITQRTKQLRNLADEREMLLKEVHHRVKNNFHTLIGLLWLEEQSKSSDETKFQNIRNRIKSMSIIHEKLYQSKDLKNISIDVYLSEIVNNLLASTKNKNIVYNEQIENMHLKFDSAISLGIIVNEVVSNSLKHNKKESLSIDFKLAVENDLVHPTISDNGIGFNTTTQNEGLGMDIIKSFSKKLLQSSFSFENKNGIIFKLDFKSDT